jgi:catechol 2,3-dioxygenase-like lactoylglutathione lyase family enzyme
MTLDRIDHIAMSVVDIAAAVEWYMATFECELEYQDDTWAMLKFGNARLALVVESQHPPHVAFERDDAEEFGELVTHRDGSRSVYVRDPSGNAVEIMAAP